MTSLTKHHGLGNDFLVMLESGDATDWSRHAQQWCDRRQGVGADGLLLLTIDELDANRLTMVLFNADGSRAEISGNGIRCLAQAALIEQRRSQASYEVHTDAGVRVVEARETGPGTIEASVAMGKVASGTPPTGWYEIGVDPMRPVTHLSLGNPHTVVGVEDLEVVDLKTLGERVPGTNLEIVEQGTTAHSIRMRVHERGAGITQACGSGACASAWAAVEWGLATPLKGEIHVQMDGGSATVRLNDPEHGAVTLVGPSVFIARIEIEDT